MRAFGQPDDCAGRLDDGLERQGDGAISPTAAARGGRDKANTCSLTRVHCRSTDVLHLWVRASVRAVCAARWQQVRVP
jgi:hypothetical protein